jgi:fido (protein-threonine AMPylation protein)
MTVDPLASFEAFRDHEDSAFYQAPGLTPQATWDEIHRSLAAVSAELVVRYESGFRLEVSVLAISEWHREIFVSTFPDDAGRFRSQDRSGEWEHISFGIEVGTARTARIRRIQGTHPNKIQGRIEDACKDFSAFRLLAEKTPEAFQLSDVTFEIARLYTKLLSIHPFVDGNLRATTIALQAALLSMDLALFDFSDYDLHQSAIATALRSDGRQSYRELGDLMAQIIATAI